MEVDKSYYSVPPEYVTRRVWVRCDSRVVRVFNQRMEQIAMHVKQEAGRFSTQDAHLASEKISAVERRAEWLLQKVGTIGKQTECWGTELGSRRGVQSVPVLQGLLALSQKHSSEEIEKACEIAVSYGAFRLKNVRRLIEIQAAKQEELEFTEDHPIIRDLSTYCELVRDSFQNQAAGKERAMK